MQAHLQSLQEHRWLDDSHEVEAAREGSTDGADWNVNSKLLTLASYGFAANGDPIHVHCSHEELGHGLLLVEAREYKDRQLSEDEKVLMRGVRKTQESEQARSGETSSTTCECTTETSTSVSFDAAVPKVAGLPANGGPEIHGGKGWSKVELDEGLDLHDSSKPRRKTQAAGQRDEYTVRRRRGGKARRRGDAVAASAPSTETRPWPTDELKRLKIECAEYMVATGYVDQGGTWQAYTAAQRTLRGYEAQLRYVEACRRAM